MNITLFETSA